MIPVVGPDIRQVDRQLPAISCDLFANPIEGPDGFSLIRNMQNLIGAREVRQVEELEPHSDRHEAVADCRKKCGSCRSVDGANDVMAIRCLAMNRRTSDFFDWRKAA